MQLEPGLYEHLITVELAELLRQRPFQVIEQDDLDPADSHERLARFIALEVALALRGIKGEQQTAKQIELVNRLLAILRELAPPGPPIGQDLAQPPQLLLAAYPNAVPARTELPFSISTVLTRAQGEPTLGHELGREIRSADHIDALVSFVTVNGVRALRSDLEAHALAGRPFRLMTTTYTGATDPAAVDLLARLPNVQVRVSYDARRTRLHAKAWLFTRATGLDTAYVGSANLSSSALFHGHEWMMKATAADLPEVIKKFRGTFETLWHDEEFEPYDPENAAHRERLREAIAIERGGGANRRAAHILPTFFNLKPYPFQAELLDKLEAERKLHDRMRNLVVAATGTGKTVLAAFDYQRQIGQSGLPPRLLFLAHRQELLTQALATFRNVLRDGNFGTLLTAGSDPGSIDHLFATIQSFNSRDLLKLQGADFWDYVVVDECHHAPADSYRAVIEQIKPRILLGLTATPERADGKPLLVDFGGHVAAEMRLWNALERQLLVPFEYYGISDNTDLRSVRWSRGAYAVEALEKIYTGDDRRAELVIEQLRRRVADPRDMRALGFCVSVDHARFMARKFTEAGIPAIALHGASLDEERWGAPKRLESRDVNVIFTCDLFNEGVDLPFVDTLLLLRPTSSSTLFLQQLGRGLRLHEKKDSCLVLDFIGQHREDYRFDKVLSAMTGLPKGTLREAVEKGFPLLPSGCHVALDRVAQDQILASLRRVLRGGERQLVEELRQIKMLHGGSVTLKVFLDETGRDLADVFTGKLSWTLLRRTVDDDVPHAGPDEATFQSKLKQLLHIDDPKRISFYRKWLTTPGLAIPKDSLSRRQILMMAYQMFHLPNELFTPESFASRLDAHPAVVQDLIELLDVLEDQVAIAQSHPIPDPEWPLQLHRSYGRREVLTATGKWSESEKPSSREGVVRLNGVKAELLFVTLDKSSKRFSPTTSYEDYAVSPELFHWQSQSRVTPESADGQRYIRQRENGWRFHLLVRKTEGDPYTYLGPVEYLDHYGSRPMSINWRLETLIPGKWVADYVRLTS